MTWRLCGCWITEKLAQIQANIIVRLLQHRSLCLRVRGGCSPPVGNRLSKIGKVPASTLFWSYSQKVSLSNLSSFTNCFTYAKSLENQHKIKVFLCTDDNLQFHIYHVIKKKRIKEMQGQTNTPFCYNFRFTLIA